MTTEQRKKELHSKIRCNLIMTGLLTFGIVCMCARYQKDKQYEEMVEAAEVDEVEIAPVQNIELPEYAMEPVLIESTAYYNKYNQPCKDGSWPVAGLTIAGRKEWLGKTCLVYETEEDGSIGSLLGIYEFRDTGFGNDLDQDGIGSIEAGTCIDIYMDTYEECMNWGRRMVWIQIIDAKG